MGCWNQRRLGARGGQVFLFENQGPLQNHFQLSSVFDIDVGATGKQGSQASGGKPRANASNSSSKRVPSRQAAYRSYRTADRDSDFRHFTCISPFVSGLLDCALAISIDGLIFGAG
jgi:hypothetical protein